MTNQNSSTTIKINIPSELGYEKVVMNAVAVIAKKMDFAANKIDDLKTAVGEACTNAIEHGNALEANRPVLVIINYDKESIRIDIIDNGCNPLPEMMPDRSQRPDFRGLGLFLTQRLMDKTEFISQPGQNIVRLLCLKSGILA